MDVLKLEPTRVWRTYIGGRTLDKLSGKDGEISSFPEDWIASMTRAVNAGREDVTDEGLSRVIPSGEMLRDLIDADRDGMLGDKSMSSMGFLMKLIDSSERLTIQVHPTREDARILFNSEYGKTESWFFLGENESYIYLSFKPGITRDRWKDLFERQNLEEMLGCLNKIKVKKGDTVIIKGGVPHAIGSDCFVCELQEPTDISIRTERTTPSGFRIADSQCHQGVGFEKMFDVFKYEGITEEEARARYFLKPASYFSNESLTVHSLIPYTVTPYFKMRKIENRGTSVLSRTGKCSVWYVLDGRGEVNGTEMKKHDRFFIPAAVNSLALDGDFSLIECYGPKREGDEDL